MQTSQSVEIAVRSSTDLASLDEFDAILTGQAEPPEIVDDPDEISRQIIMQLLSAESEAELESFGQTLGWGDAEGIPMQISGFRWRPSSFDEGGPVYVIVNAFRLDTGEAVVLTTGSGNVLAQLSWLARNGRLPGAVRELVKAEKATARGYHPLQLRTPDASHPALQRLAVKEPEPEESES
jgi:hypothetical protein